MTFLILLPPSNMFHCHCLVLLSLKHPNMSFFNNINILSLLRHYNTIIYFFSFNVKNNLIGRIILTHYNGSTSDSFFNDRNNETALSNDHSTNVNASLLRAGIREALSTVTDTTLSTSVNIVLHAAVSISSEESVHRVYGSTVD